MFKYKVTFDNGDSSVATSSHAINGMPKKTPVSKRQHYKIVIPAFVNNWETEDPYGTFDPFAFITQLIQSDPYYWGAFVGDVHARSMETRFNTELKFGTTSRATCIDFWQQEGCDIDAANGRAEEILQLVGDQIVENAKAVGGTTFVYEEMWNCIYCISDDNIWQYQAHEEPLVPAQFMCIRSVSGMMPVDEAMWRDYINRFNKHVGGPEPDFSQATWYGPTESESQYGPVSIGESVAAKVRAGEMTEYFQDDPTYYYTFDCYF